MPRLWEVSCTPCYALDLTYVLRWAWSADINQILVHNIGLIVSLFLAHDCFLISPFIILYS
jgi:hypothetical protein